MISFEQGVAGIDLILLVMIWLDGRAMKKSAIATEKLYSEWFMERRAERASRQESARKAREAKAAKADIKNEGI